MKKYIYFLNNVYIQFCFKNLSLYKINLQRLVILYESKANPSTSEPLLINYNREVLFKNKIKHVIPTYKQF